MKVLDKCEEYAVSVEEAKRFLSGLCGVGIISVEDVQRHDAKLLGLDIEAVLEEIRKLKAQLWEVENIFRGLINDPRNTTRWMNAERSIYYNEQAIKDKLSLDGWDSQRIDFFLMQVYKLQQTIMERTHFVKMMFELLRHPGQYKGLTLDDLITPSLKVNLDKLKPFFVSSFLGAGMAANRWLEFEIDMQKKRSAKDYGRIASMLYNSRQLNKTKRPITFAEFLKIFEDVIGFSLSDSQRKESKLRPTPELEKEFNYL